MPRRPTSAFGEVFCDLPLGRENNAVQNNAFSRGPLEWTEVWPTQPAIHRPRGL